MALAATVAVFDRTTLSGISKLWLGSAIAFFVLAYWWWVRPSLEDGKLRLQSYEPGPLVLLTLPLLMACWIFIALVYASDEVHGYVYYNFYYGRLLSKSYWPVGLLTALLLGSFLLSFLRDTLKSMESEAPLSEAAHRAVSNSQGLIPVGIMGFGLLLSTASLSAINVNFWRYWATADGWVTIGHYPSTMSDILQIVEGGVAPYFISFPLLPAMLLASFKLAGHNTLGAYLPIILANTLLPLGVYLTVRQITARPLLALVFAALTAAFPLLRSYTMDVGEADALLMTAVVFAAYFRLRADRPGASTGAQVAAGVSAAIAAFARPEGVLYVAPMWAASALGRWQSRRFWVSVAVLAPMLAAFSAVCIREFGLLWPGNHSGSISFSNFVRTLEVANRSGVYPMYAQALGVSTGVLTALITAVLVLLGFSSYRMLRKDYRLVYMPVMALANVVMVFFVGPIPAEASKFHDLFRHISYGFPLLGITMAYGVNELLVSLRGRWQSGLRFVVLLAVAALVLTEMSILEGPVRPTDTVRSPLMSSDVHVTAAQLLVDPYPLPVMKFRREGARYIPDSPQYMATYPDDVYEYYEQADVRRYDNPAEYYTSAKVIFLFLLAIGALPSIWMAKGRAKAYMRFAPGSRPPAAGLRGSAVN